MAVMESTVMFTEYHREPYDFPYYRSRFLMCLL